VYCVEPRDIVNVSITFVARSNIDGLQQVNVKRERDPVPGAFLHEKGIVPEGFLAFFPSFHASFNMQDSQWHMHKSNGRIHVLHADSQPILITNEMSPK
jgi:hypothetical protein